MGRLMVMKKEGWGENVGEEGVTRPNGQQIEMRYMRACIYRDDTRAKFRGGCV